MKKKLFLIFTLISISTVLLGAEKSKEEYMNDLSSDDVKTVVEAEKWLGNKKEKKAVEKLVDLNKNSSSKEIRMNAAVALGLIGDKNTVDGLIDQLLVERNADVRYALVLAITRIGIKKKSQYDKIMQAADNESDALVLDYLKKIKEKIDKDAK